MDLHDTTFRAYIEGNASAAEQQRADEHLKECGDCREYVKFVRDLSTGIKEISEDALGLEDRHASSSTIFAYTEGTLDAESSLHLRSHMLFCDSCAETYYLLKRMRAPSWVEVVIGIIQRAKEFLLKPIEIVGMGELVPLPVTVTKGPGEESQEGQSRVEITQHVTDSGEEADILFSLEPEGDEPVPTFILRIEIDPPQDEWRAHFFGADGKRLASVPLSLKSQIIFSNFSMGSFTAQVQKGDELLAECRLKIQRSEKPTI